MVALAPVAEESAAVVPVPSSKFHSPTVNPFTPGWRRGGNGMIAVDPTGRGVLVVRKLPAAPAGKTYEAWVIPPGGEPKRAGLFRGGESPTMLTLDEMVPRGSVVAATMERRGGVDKPTETPLFSAQA